MGCRPRLTFLSLTTEERERTPFATTQRKHQQKLAKMIVTLARQTHRLPSEILQMKMGVKELLLNMVILSQALEAEGQGEDAPSDQELTDTRNFFLSSLGRPHGKI